MVGWGGRVSLTHGPLMGTIWDPSPEIHSHVPPVDGNWSELVALPWEWNSRFKLPEETGSDSVDAKEEIYKNVINDGMI